jgi:hypothetical protein
VFKRPTITPREPALLEKAETIEKKKTNIVRKGGLTLAACMALAEDVFAQATDPWTQAVQALQTAFTGPIATGLSEITNDFSGGFVGSTSFTPLPTLPRFVAHRAFSRGPLIPAPAWMPPNWPGISTSADSGRATIPSP